MKDIVSKWFSQVFLIITKLKIHAVARVLLAICILGITGYAFAGGEDILSGTDTSLIATLNGSGKKYIYLVEGFLSLAMYIKTKNLLVLFGIVIVAVFFNIILKIAGVTG